MDVDENLCLELLLEYTSKVHTFWILYSKL